MLLLAICVLGFLAVLRIFFCALQLRKTPRSGSRTGSVNTMVVLGSGGHTAEMMALLHSLDRTRYRPLVYVLAETDTTSEVRVAQQENERGNSSNCVFLRIPRSREVKQTYLSSIGTTLYSFVFALSTVWRRKPELLLVNGPGTCIPVCAAAFLCYVLLNRSCPIIFTESFCRTESLSLSGKILYPVASRFLVHWPRLQSKYPRSEYIGRLF